MPATNVAIVTGASSGVGRVTAIALSAAGWNVALTARREDLLRTAQAECPNESLIVAGDITNEKFVADLYKKTIDKFGRLDLLFNNAGISLHGAIPIEDLPLQDFLNVLNVNVTAAFICTQHAVRQFKSQSPPGGRIINNGSLSAITPRPHSAPYTLSKHAITGLTKSTALDGRAFDITVTQIDIGGALTDMSKSVLEGALQPDGSVRPEVTFDPQHLASTLVHIASLPNTTQVLNLTIMANKMPFVGRG
ncbi:short-chain dehydrogenase/reductase SDR [Auriculariales sp. MPI-PUGE-AT-0066]|nr:short-chain dehydrogenase/reductase SDR [Auriculariales sp. MPI-PUGE-AT-0066]